jgi:hypothetical protein
LPEGSLGAHQSADKAESDEVKLVSTLAASSVQNARTVVSTNIASILELKFSSNLVHIASAHFAITLKVAVLAGVSQFVSWAIWSLAFWFAGKMVELDECSVPNVFSVGFI